MISQAGAILPGALMFFVFSMIALSLLPSGAAASDASGLRHDIVYRGTPVGAVGQAWKYSAHLLFDLGGGTFNECSSAFIAPDVILTAGHCKIRNNGSLEVSLFHQNSRPPLKIALSGSEYRHVPHPGYKANGEAELDFEDLALVVLRTKRLPPGFEPVIFGHPVIEAISQPGKPVVVVGAGYNEKLEDSDRLYYAQGNITALEEQGYVKIALSGSQGICSGDSGGPVLVNSGGRLFLTAVTAAITGGTLNEHCGNTLDATLLTPKRNRWILDAVRATRESFSR